MTTNILRWTARIVGGSIFLVWGFLFVADLFGPNIHKDVHPITKMDIFYLSMVIICIIGLVLSWKWELAGGMITLLAYILMVIIIPKVLMLYIHYIFPILAITIIVVWAMSRKAHETDILE